VNEEASSGDPDASCGEPVATSDRFTCALDLLSLVGGVAKRLVPAVREIAPDFGDLVENRGRRRVWSATMKQGLVRPVIEAVSPSVDCGMFPAKREVGDLVVVEADAFSDGHDELACEIRWRHDSERDWTTKQMYHLGNDRWRADFDVEQVGTYWFQVRAGIDPFGGWARDLRARAGCGQDLSVELEVGARVLDQLAERSSRPDRDLFTVCSQKLREAAEIHGIAEPESLLNDDVLEAAKRYPQTGTETSSDSLAVTVDRKRARFGSWYEMFPRSCSPEPGRQATFADVIARLPYVAGLGFDILYLPPIHPIGVVNRKGRDGSTRTRPGDPGSPWAIGSEAGGHDAVHPGLGTVGDLELLVDAASKLGIEIALDFALQCAPDHPWVKEHPDWFKVLPDGTIRYAENPPKRYEDIYPLDFSTPDWLELWDAVLGVVMFWIDHGIRIFRVDNPHTKPFRLWEWLIATVRVEHPDVIFLSEAFTRPKVMQRLAKVGFSQSYTYFAWRTAKWELEEYLTELHASPVAEFMRPNLWPNTPDILTQQLQSGGRSVFVSRLVLAATMASSYGIYGPAFELQEAKAREVGSEEYQHSEKYEVRHWKIEDSSSIAPLVSTLNRIRCENPALQHDRNLRFHHVDNEHVIAYSRQVEPGANTVIVVVNLDPSHTQSGWIDLDLEGLGIHQTRPFAVHDLLTDVTFTWSGSRNFVSLDPTGVPAHVLRVESFDPESSLPHHPTEPRR
jgi:starch synthase (maltosyl-transferring)